MNHVTNQILDRTAIFALAEAPLDHLTARAAALRDAGFGHVMTWSPKVFIPLTRLCRDVCHYCTFATSPASVPSPYLKPEEVLAIARQGAAAGCVEALFTLGDRPEDRYRQAETALAELGYESTLDYLEAMARLVRDETGLLPHLNPGLMDDKALARLRPVAGSMGLMLESVSDRLCGRGGVHFGSPDKVPARRLATLIEAGKAQVPFTTGLLIGIGETRAERIETLLAIAEIHGRFGHIQEVIVQNFKAKASTRMAHAPEPSLGELRWTIAVARLILGPTMSIQAPPNLSPGVLSALVGAGINDWGGVSPVTPDHVNPEAPWPTPEFLARETAKAGKTLAARLTIYPAFTADLTRWADAAMRPLIRAHSDASGLARMEEWSAGAVQDLPRAPDVAKLSAADTRVAEILAATSRGELLGETEITALFEARGSDVDRICEAADHVRRDANGDDVTYVVNRNINYTNICGYHCRFCAFSKGKTSEALRSKPYLLDSAEVARRVAEARDRGATEVCMQGGIHPDFDGNTYLSLCATALTAAPGIHVHAFSPLEIFHGATTLGLSAPEFLARLRAAGLGSLPGTAAEILDDEVRADLCPDKLNTAQWLEIIGAAHRVGLRTTATMMFGHVDRPHHWARHLIKIRDLQMRTGGFTEFVPLPFVHMEAPMFRKGLSRKGPTWREVRLVHAVARLVLHPHIVNIQASWVKLGREGIRALLDGGVNDLGGTLMDESITRAAGAAHGQEFGPDEMIRVIREAGRTPRQRTTLYGRIQSEGATSPAH